MEVLLLLAFFISPASHAQELRRLEKRAAGYDQHLMELEQAELRRLADTAKQKQVRYEQLLKYEKIRDSFVRPPVRRDPRLEQAYQQMLKARRAEELRRQMAYANEHRDELKLIEQKNRRLKPREYDINGGKP